MGAAIPALTGPIRCCSGGGPSMIKDQAGQGFYVLALNITTMEGETGDAGNITATISKDGSTPAVATDDVNPTEVGGGVYWFDTTRSETNANEIAAIPVSDTPGVHLEPRFIPTMIARS